MSIPIDYVRDNVAVAYALTVRKAQGLMTDEAVLVVDGASRLSTSPWASREDAS